MLLNWLLPQNCFLCGDLSQQPICEPCYADLPTPATNRCYVCAKSLPPTTTKCEDCRQLPPPFNHTQTLLAYLYPVNKLIQATKFQQNLALLKFLGNRLATHLSITQPPDVLIPVPLHPKRLRERGYNQSVELAKCIAKHHHLTIAYQACERCRNTPPQVTLPAWQRKTNLQDAFRVKYLKPHWQHIVLIDDVMTTGTTVTELAKELVAAGISNIEVWCCARR